MFSLKMIEVYPEEIMHIKEAYVHRLFRGKGRPEVCCATQKGYYYWLSDLAFALTDYLM